MKDMVLLVVVFTPVSESSSTNTAPRVDPQRYALGYERIFGQSQPKSSQPN